MFALLTFLKFMKKNTPTIKVDQVEEILRNGMAYAWEVGSGAPLMEKVNVNTFNPFIHSDWRKYVIPGEEVLPSE